MSRRSGHKRSGNAPSQRQLRVGEEIRHLLAEIFGRGELRDPDLQNRVITVTEVRISPDLHNATAFVVPLGGGEDEGQTMLAGLKRVAPYLRSVLGHTMRLRTVPNIGFELDQSFDYANRIDVLLHSPGVRRDLEEDALDDEDREED